DDEQVDQATVHAAYDRFLHERGRRPHDRDRDEDERERRRPAARRDRDEDEDERERRRRYRRDRDEDEQRRPAARRDRDEDEDERERRRPAADDQNGPYDQDVERHRDAQQAGLAESAGDQGLTEVEETDSSILRFPRGLPPSAAKALIAAGYTELMQLANV